jgi:hypothetical protein
MDPTQEPLDDTKRYESSNIDPTLSDFVGFHPFVYRDTGSELRVKNGQHRPGWDWEACDRDDVSMLSVLARSSPSDKLGWGFAYLVV